MKNFTKKIAFSVQINAKGQKNCLHIQQAKMLTFNLVNQHGHVLLGQPCSKLIQNPFHWNQKEVLATKKTWLAFLCTKSPVLQSGLSEPGGQAGAHATPDFSRSVNPISTGGADFVPIFSDLPTSLTMIFIVSLPPVRLLSLKPILIGVDFKRQQKMTN